MATASLGAVGGGVPIAGAPPVDATSSPTTEKVKKVAMICFEAILFGFAGGFVGALLGAVLGLGAVGVNVGFIVGGLHAALSQTSRDPFVDYADVPVFQHVFKRLLLGELAGFYVAGFIFMLYPPAATTTILCSIMAICMVAGAILGCIQVRDNPDAARLIR